ncbi:MAG TPA: DUF695 domain-containing protein [Burkholderiaceae bacterium]|jgi:hypothetical protein
MRFRTISPANYFSLALIALVFPAHGNAKELWWSYSARYDGGTGTTRINLDLKSKAPNPDYSTLVITGSAYTSKRRDGLPDPVEAERLDALRTKVLDTIQKVTPSIYAGTFTQNRDEKHYIYVKDGKKVEKALNQLYAGVCPKCGAHTVVRDDKAWELYTGFLFPNETTRDYYRADLKKLGFSE